MEVTITCSAAAIAQGADAIMRIANAVYHATGKRIRELPITPDKLMA